MGILTDIEEVARARRLSQIRCPVARAIGSMTEEDAEAFEAALSDWNIEHVTLRQVLQKNGYKIGDKAVSNHRNGKCSCEDVR